MTEVKKTRKDKDFVQRKREENKMKPLQYKTLDECVECYGRGNLIAIDTLPQIIMYITKGCQPKFVSENQNKPGRITCWFLKSETAYVYKLWQESNPKKVNKDVKQDRKNI